MKISLLVPLFFLGLVSCISGSDEVGKISAKVAAQLVQENKAVLIDVREKDEIALGMAQPAKWFPSSKLNTAEWDQFLVGLPKDKEVILYCRSGRRASNVAKILTSKGYKVKNMGAFDSWVQEKLPTISGATTELKK